MKKPLLFLIGLTAVGASLLLALSVVDRRQPPGTDLVGLSDAPVSRPASAVPPSVPEILRPTPTAVPSAQQPPAGPEAGPRPESLPGTTTAASPRPKAADGKVNQVFGEPITDRIARFVTFPEFPFAESLVVPTEPFLSLSEERHLIPNEALFGILNDAYSQYIAGESLMEGRYVDDGKGIALHWTMDSATVDSQPDSKGRRFNREYNVHIRGSAGKNTFSGRQPFIRITATEDGTSVSANFFDDSGQLLTRVRIHRAPQERLLQGFAEDAEGIDPRDLLAGVPQQD